MRVFDRINNLMSDRRIYFKGIVKCDGIECDIFAPPTIVSHPWMYLKEDAAKIGAFDSGYEKREAFIGGAFIIFSKRVTLKNPVLFNFGYASEEPCLVSYTIQKISEWGEISSEPISRGKKRNIAVPRERGFVDTEYRN